MTANKAAWIDDIQVGDILMEGDTPRIVRDVSRYKGTTCVTFTIRHCSWTTRCYTILTSSDLKCRRFRPTGKRVRLTTKMDEAIRADFGRHIKDVTLHCCDVEGIG